MQEDDESDGEVPLNDAYDEAGVLTAQLSQLLDLRIVSTSERAGRIEVAQSNPSNGSQEPEKEIQQVAQAELESQPGTSEPHESVRQINGNGKLPA